MFGVGQVTPTPHPTHTHAHTLRESGEPRSFCLDQMTREAVIQDHCSGSNPLLRRSTQVPWSTGPLRDRRQRLSPIQLGPVCAFLVGGQGPRRQKHLPLLAHQHLLPSPTTLPSPTAGLAQMRILTTSCQSRGCLHRDPKRQLHCPKAA